MSKSPKTKWPVKTKLLLPLSAISLGLSLSGISPLSPLFLLPFAISAKHLPIWRGADSELFFRLCLFYSVSVFPRLLWITVAFFGYADGTNPMIYFLGVFLYAIPVFFLAVVHFLVVWIGDLAKTKAGALLYCVIHPLQFHLLAFFADFPFVMGSFLYSDSAFILFQQPLGFFGSIAVDTLLLYVPLLLITGGLGVFWKALGGIGALAVLTLPAILPRETPLRQKEATLYAVSKTGFSAEALKTKVNNLLKQTGRDEEFIVAFPESALAGNLSDGDLLHTIASEMQGKKGLVVFGGNETRYPQGRKTVYNSAFALREGVLFDVYRKNHLVPFAEYVPTWFQKLGVEKLKEPSITYQTGNFAIIEWNGLKIALGVCYDSLVPSWFQNARKAEADLLLVIARESILPRFSVERIKRIERVWYRETQIPYLKISDTGPVVFFDGFSERKELAGEKERIALFKPPFQESLPKPLKALLVLTVLILPPIFVSQFSPTPKPTGE